MTASLRRSLLAAGAALLAIGASPSPRLSAEGQGPTPFALILGTAQDGGLPQLGGNSDQDVAARQDPGRRRLVASLLVVDPSLTETLMWFVPDRLSPGTMVKLRLAPLPSSLNSLTQFAGAPAVGVIV